MPRLFLLTEHDPREPLQGSTGPLEVKDHTRFVADYPAVMSGGSNHEVTRFDLWYGDKE
jgi:hypothetical protein